MDVIRQAGEFDTRGNTTVCAAIGMFDGVHLGHQRVLRQTVQSAQAAGGLAVAITFDRHPNSVVAPERTPPLIYSLGQRQRVIASLGIDTLLLIHFDQAFSQQSGEQFVTSLVEGFGRLGAICVGSDFTFGYRRSGDVALLRRLGETFGFALQPVPAVVLDGEVVSSTRIRQAVQAGDFGGANAMLGRAYAMAGRVLRGDQVGRQLGFPTANLDGAGLALAPTGVYAGRARVAGDSFRAVANIGYRPSLEQPVPQLRVEVHLLDFYGDLYGEEVEFEFVKVLRGERKFSSLESLKEQIAADVAAARVLLA